DHVDGDLVGDELAGLHVRLRAHAQRGGGGDVRPEDVTGGELRHRQVGRDELRLGTLARAGGTDQYQSHLPSRRPGRSTTVGPLPTITTGGTLRSCAA